MEYINNIDNNIMDNRKEYFHDYVRTRSSMERNRLNAEIISAKKKLITTKKRLMNHTYDNLIDVFKLIYTEKQLNYPEDEKKIIYLINKIIY